MKKLRTVSTSNVADALDSLSLKGATHGITPMFDCGRILGSAVTVKITAAGLTRTPIHIGQRAIEAGKRGDVIVIDNGGRTDVSCWGGILGSAAKAKGIAGVVIDGAFRDLDELEEMSFPVFARGVVPMTGRGRIQEDAFNVLVQFGGVQVRPGDIVLGDRSGVVIIPQERADEVVGVALGLAEKEDAYIHFLKKGTSISEVDKKFRYEHMLERKGRVEH